MPKTNCLRACVSAALFLAAIAPASRLHAQGIALTGVGPVNRSMGGAGTAAPLDALGAVHWNPGSISGLQGNQIAFGVELLNANIKTTSPFGAVTGDAGWSSAPTIGMVHHLDGTPITLGLGIFGVAGFKNNMPVNQLFGGPPPNPPLSAYASADILQIAPTLSYQLTERFSLGFAPTITTETVNFNPLGPGTVIIPGAPVAPLVPGQGNRMHWGGGFQVGGYYKGDSGINGLRIFIATAPD